jgi:hypothetical protein
MPDAKNYQENQGESTLKEMHKTFLEALRQREQEIFGYLTTLGLAFGGFGWLLVQENSKEHPATKAPFIFGTLGVLLLLCLGALYALALGYNYRYITFQLAKIESFLNIERAMLTAWPRSVEKFKKYTVWCFPPEIIKIFWGAFTVGILFVTWFGAKASNMPVRIWFVGSILFLISALSPLYFGLLFRRLWKKEELPWPKAESK